MKVMTATEAYAAWSAGEAHILDIREEVEYEENQVPGVRLLPMSELGERLDEVPTDRQLVIICRSGSRSAYVAEALTTHGGFGDVANLEGGIIAWAAAGLPYEGEPPQ
jgi:rhodanese-related sulfurtransferase